ncbi:MAG: hypothetical protein ABIK28_09455 [Planctomycetota bacterium]
MTSLKPIPPNGSSIDDKIFWAEETARNVGEPLSADPRIDPLLATLRELTADIMVLMRETGLVEICRHCEEDEGGSCCGRGIENRYDAVLLLINLMLGMQLRKAPINKSSCRFLGEQGCSLLARIVICISYVCDSITLNIPVERLSGLREKEGELLKTLYQLDINVREALAEYRDAQ